MSSIKTAVTKQQEYKKLLLQSGKLKPEAVTLLADLAQLCYAETALSPDCSSDMLRDCEGGRRLYFHIIAALSLDLEAREVIRKTIVESIAQEQAKNSTYSSFYEALG